MDVKTVIGTEYNGRATYSLVPKEGKTIFSNIKMENLIEAIVKQYPELVLEIHDIAEESYIRELPKELDLSKFDYCSRAEIVEEIVRKVKAWDKDFRQAVRERKEKS